MYHAYEKGYHTLGRQTLLEPLERTGDGWFRPVEGLDIAGPIPMPPGEAVQHAMALSDDFGGKQPGPQWRFHEPSPWTFDRPAMERVRMTGQALEMTAEGESVADSRPMLCIPVDRAYEVSVEVECPNSAQAALALYYNEECHAGIAATRDEDGPRAALWRRCGPFGGQSTPGAIRRLRITNDHHQVSFAYDAGQGWTTIQRATETSGYHHNVFGGFVSLRAGLVACGRGTVRFRNFRYRALRCTDV
jgi:xylan 1,4-beta-xylosidase